MILPSTLDVILLYLNNFPQNKCTETYTCQCMPTRRYCWHPKISFLVLTGRAHLFEGPWTWLRSWPEKLPGDKTTLPEHRAWQWKRSPEPVRCPFHPSISMIVWKNRWSNRISRINFSDLCHGFEVSKQGWVPGGRGQLLVKLRIY